MCIVSGQFRPDSAGRITRPSVLCNRKILRIDPQHCDCRRRDSKSARNGEIRISPTIRICHSALVHSRQRLPACGVRGEHSYARERRDACGAGGPRGCGGLGDRTGAVRVRTLLVRRPPRCPHCRPVRPERSDTELDVAGSESGDRRARSPDSEPEVDRASDVEVGADWEERLEALAPTPAHRRLATAAADVLRSLRLARLAGGGADAREDARTHAARLRRALAGAWGGAAAGPAHQRPPAWLHAALTAYLPLSMRRLYDDILAELRRTLPELCERLPAGRAPVPEEPEPAPARPLHSRRPLLLWLPSGCEPLDDRWEKTFRALVPFRRIDVPTGECPRRCFG